MWIMQMQGEPQGEKIARAPMLVRRPALAQCSAYARTNASGKTWRYLASRVSEFAVKSCYTSTIPRRQVWLYLLRFKPNKVPHDWAWWRKGRNLKWCCEYLLFLAAWGRSCCTCMFCWMGQRLREGLRVPIRFPRKLRTT